MQYLVFFLAFIFGTIIGSFLNVVALRFRTGKSVGGRSLCFSCGKTLRFYELVPLLSFVFQRGKCRGCRSSISIQYPLVELLTGVAFGLLALYSTTLFWFLLHAAAFSILMVIAVYDIRHKIIPDSLSFAFGVLGFVAMLALNWNNLFSFEGLLALLAGPLLFLPFFILWLISGGVWMGLGDAKLSVGIGWLLGLASGISALIIGVWAGALWSVVAMATRRGRKLTFKSEIPLAPFLIFGTFLSLLIHPDIFSLNLWLSFLN
ncbi:MAG TPA: prepilin peptidase [Candidatus Paceibacterota bacterium]|nr:prepilin peptidase [Candidatus Paceibacterota bacterium]